MSYLDLSNGNFKHCDLTYTNMFHTSVTKALFKKALMEKTVLTGCEGTDVNFAGAEMNEVRLDDSLLEKADFSATTMVGVKFCNASIKDSSFNKSSQTKVDYTDATLKECTFEVGERFLGD